MHGTRDHGFKRGLNGRAVQLDGLRAIAMMAICWDHWCPAGWPRIFPFEIFLFFFLVLTGYLVTTSLLRERDRAGQRGGPWKAAALKTYQIRRGLRILVPYYAALALALVVMAPDAWKAFPWYFFHLSNFHIATLPDWPGGTNHFWSLSIQQQFYLFWPFVIWFLPRKALIPAVCLFAAAGPVSRLFYDSFLPWFHRPDVLTWMTFDYFGLGALFALAVHRGMSFESPILRAVSWLGFAAYLAIFGAHAAGWPTFGFRPLQQTFLSIALCGFIASAIVGFRGPAGRMLEGAFLQRVGQLSYGVYLFHNLAPLVAGKVFFFLWFPPFGGITAEILKIVAAAGVTWGLTLASWRWIEEPLQGVRTKMTPR